MSLRSAGLSPELEKYVQAMCRKREDPVAGRIRESTAAMPNADMQISIEQGQLMGVLAQMLGAKRALEIGTFTGYSALCVARHLPAGGKLVCCDVFEEYTGKAKPFWAEAGVADRIDLRIGPASQTLAHLIEKEDAAGTFDLAFVDADKEGYDDYYEKCLVLLRSGGAVLLDNAFRDGRVVKEEDEGSVVVRNLTAKVFEDERVDPAIIPISDGVLMARKR